jgi:hypothetical protein
MIDLCLRALSDYMARTNKSTSYADFWTGWDEVAGDLASHAWAEGVTPELREAYAKLLAEADDRGWVVPLEQCQL